MEFGKWEINTGIDVMPQKVATAFAEIADTMVGAEYTPIAYLGSQLANGINHAILAEQLLTDGKDTKNVVLLIFNEKGMGCHLANIERIVESGAELGGTKVDVKVDIPEDAMKVFNDAFNDYIGVEYKPFALLATQITKGITYVYAAEANVLTAENEKKITIIVLNALTNRASFVDVLKSGVEVSLGKPLGEWP